MDRWRGEWIRERRRLFSGDIRRAGVGRVEVIAGWVFGITASRSGVLAKVLACAREGVIRWISGA